MGKGRVFGSQGDRLASSEGLVFGCMCKGGLWFGCAGLGTGGLEFLCEVGFTVLVSDVHVRSFG